MPGESPPLVITAIRFAILVVMREQEEAENVKQWFLKNEACDKNTNLSKGLRYGRKRSSQVRPSSASPRHPIPTTRAKQGRRLGINLDGCNLTTMSLIWSPKLHHLLAPRDSIEPMADLSKDFGCFNCAASAADVKVFI